MNTNTDFTLSIQHMLKQITATLGDREQQLDDTPEGKLKSELTEFFEDVRSMPVQWLYVPQTFANVVDKINKLSPSARYRITNAWISYKSHCLNNTNEYNLLVDRMVRSLDLIGVHEISKGPVEWQMHNHTVAVVEAVKWRNPKQIAFPRFDGEFVVPAPINVVHEYTLSNQHLVMIYVMHLALNLN